jgi:hypothetical protein
MLPCVEKYLVWLSGVTNVKIGAKFNRACRSDNAGANVSEHIPVFMRRNAR